MGSFKKISEALGTFLGRNTNPLGEVSLKMTSNLFMKIACGHDGTLRCFEEEYVSAEVPIGYIAYKINTCAPPGRRDLSAYSTSHLYAVNSLMSGSSSAPTFDLGPKDFPIIKSK